MSKTFTGKPCQVYKIECESGGRYVIYNASEIIDPSDHLPGMWYFQPYPIPLGLKGGEPFETAADAEQAARLHDALLCAP